MTESNFPLVSDPLPAEQKSFAGMPVSCPKCNKLLAGVSPVATLLLTVHCPYDGENFGVKVYPAGETPETPETANPPAGGWR